MRNASQLLLTFLLNACWQIALITVAAALCTRLLRGASARHKHWLWVAALALSLGLPMLTMTRLSGVSFFRRQAWPPNMVTPTIIGALPSPQLISSDALMPSTSPPIPRQETKPMIPVNRNFALVLAALYLLYLSYRSLKLLRAWLKVRAIIRSAYPIELSEHLQTIIERCQTVFSVTQVRLLCSPEVTLPITVGGLTPLIILPEQLLQEAEANVLTSAIGHELAHVLRRDYLLNLIYEFIYLPLSFHPAATRVKRRIQETRELRCDELVTERLLDAEVYARSLVQLASSALPVSHHTTTITVGIIDADILEERVMSMLSRPKINMRRKSWLLVAAALCFVVPCLAATPFALGISINPQDAPQEIRQKEEPRRVEFISNNIIINEETVTLVAWLKKPGDQVERGETLAKVETNQGVMEVEATMSGTVERLLVQIGEKTQVGRGFVTIREQGQSAGQELFLREGQTGVAFRAVTEPERWSRAEWRGVAVTVAPQEGDAQEAQKREARERAERERREAGEKETRVRTEQGQTVVLTEQESQDPEIIARRKAERERMAKRQSELAKQATITMQQAIQTVTNQYPGTVLESRLVRERDQACYVITVLSDNGTETTTTRVLMSAVDGRVINTFKEER